MSDFADKVLRRLADIEERLGGVEGRTSIEYSGRSRQEDEKLGSAISRGTRRWVTASLELFDDVGAAAAVAATVTTLAANDFLVKTASASLSAERVVTDTSNIVVDWGTAGQAKFDLTTTGVSATSYGDTDTVGAFTVDAKGRLSAAAAVAIRANAAAGPPSFRKIGTGATDACAGNDSRLSDSRAPSGVAGGALAGSTYPNPAIATSSADLSADVTLTNAATYYDGPSVSLAAGTWLVIGWGLVSTGGINVSPTANIRLHDGTNVLATAEDKRPLVVGTTHEIDIACGGYVTLGGTTTVKLQAKGDAAGWTLLKNAPNETGTVVTRILALRIA